MFHGHGVSAKLFATPLQAALDKEGGSDFSSDSSTTRWVVSLNDTILAADDELTDPAMDFGVFSHRGLHSGEDPVSLKAHLNGTCQPCVFNPTNRGCTRGDSCSYCHCDHPLAALNRRVRKRTRDKITRRLKDLLVPPVDLEEIHEQLQLEAAHHIFGRTMIQNYLQDPDPDRFFSSFET